MKVLKIMTTDGAIYHLPLERIGGYGPLSPNFPDAERVELVDMHADAYLGLSATTESARRFGFLLPA